MVYYKVLREVNGELVSINNKTPVVYSKTDWNRPTIPSSRLFVFSQLSDAEAFTAGFKNQVQEIWSCEIEGLGDIQPLRDINQTEEYWKKRKNHKPTDSYTRQNFNMVSCTGLKLVAKVK